MHKIVGCLEKISVVAKTEYVPGFYDVYPFGVISLFILIDLQLEYAILCFIYTKLSCIKLSLGMNLLVNLAQTMFIHLCSYMKTVVSTSLLFF